MAIGLTDIEQKKKIRVQLPNLSVDGISPDKSDIVEKMSTTEREIFKPWSEHIGQDREAMTDASMHDVATGPMQRAEMAVSRAKSIVENNLRMIEGLKARRVVRDFKVKEEQKLWVEEETNFFRPSDFRDESGKKIDKRDGIIQKFHRFLMS